MLRSFFKLKNGRLSCLMLLLFLSIDIALAQNASITVKGRILDTSGQPVVGAAVVQSGTNNGTVTDIDGNYSIKVPSDATLEVMSIGYNRQSIPVNGQSSINFELEDEFAELEEIQVVAYGSQKKVTVTGAIASVGGAELVKAPTGSVSNMLTGQLAGLTTVQYSGEPGSDAASIFIRGQATWTNSSPLIQVDGVERDFNEIDPNEIESITILKDASATAVFGVRGANGVVLITTKRGSEGKAKISASTSFSCLMPTKTIPMANSYEYATFYNQTQINDHMYDVYDADAESNWVNADGSINESKLMFQSEIIELFKNHTDPIRFPDVDWIDYCLKDATLQTQHNVNISGGTDRVRYFVSAGFYTQGGLFKDFDLPYDLTYQYKRVNYRSNIDLDVTKTTTISTSLAGNVNNAWKPYTGQGSSGMLLEMYYATPFSSPGLVDGKLVYAATDYTDYTLPFVGGCGLTYYGGGFMQTSNNTLTADVEIKQKLDFLTKGLQFHVKGSYNSGFTAYTYATASVATYTPVLQDDGSILYKKSGTDSQLSYTNTDPGYSRNWYMETAFNYDRTFMDTHHVTFLAMYNQSKTYYPSTYPEIPTGYVGLVGRVTYDYKSRYMAEFNIGYNGSENFAPGNRFGAFPAGSFGWNISEENFWAPIKPIVSYFKIRYTIGTVGNDQIGGTRFMYTADPYVVNDDTSTNRGGFSYNFGIENSTTSNGTYEESKNNADVTWEKSTKQNYGVDLNLFDDKLRFTYDYYNEKRRKILLTDGTAPSVLGFTTPMANLGKVDSWGWELTAKWNQRVGSNFMYNIGVNLMYNQNKIIEKKEAPLDYEYQYAKGYRIGSRLLYEFFEYYEPEKTEERYLAKYGQEMPTQLVDGILPGDCIHVDQNGDGVIDANDQIRDLHYTDDPRYMIGINAGFTWGHFDFSMLWAGAWNVTRLISASFRQPFTDRQGANQGGLVRYHLNHTWTEENPDQGAEYPRSTFDRQSNNYADSDLWEKDAKYIRLKNVSISYNFDFPFMDVVGLNTLQLSFTGYNLLTITPYIWGDPESNASSSPSYPLSRTISASLKLGF